MFVASPASPFAPVAPVTPVAPVAPVFVASPGIPCGPVAPVAPVLPVAPVFDAIPEIPCGPVGPIEYVEKTIFVTCPSTGLVISAIIARRYPIILGLVGVKVHTRVNPEPLSTYQYKFVPSKVIIYIFPVLWVPRIIPEGITVPGNCVAGSGVLLNEKICQ